jgi:hypothetical protein
MRDILLAMRRILVVAAVVAFAEPARAQVHYYNLDAGRPGRVEDAVASERYELEVQFAPFRFERLADGSSRWRAEPKLSYGVAPFTELELRAPVIYTSVANTSMTGGLAGIGVGALHAWNLERTYVPAFALAGEVMLPAGSLAPPRSTFSVKAIATKTTPFFRAHVNAAFGNWSLRSASFVVDSTCTFSCVEPPPVPIPDTPCDRLPSDGGGSTLTVNRVCNGAFTSSRLAPTAERTGNRWMAGAGVDHAFPLESTLIAADVFAERVRGLYAVTDWTAELGLRHQWTPRLTIDVGVARHFAGTFPSTSIGLGATFSLAMRPVSGAGVVMNPMTRAFPQTYLAARHNWTFRKRFNDVDRLFNAFDYGHAAMYEALLVRGHAAAAHLEGPEYDFITKGLLRHPPSVPLEERAIGPDYGTLIPEVLEMFEWAHMLHRQLYDVLADHHLSQSQRDARVAEVVRYYQSRPDLALSAHPKSMELMEGQSYSLAFRRAAPKFNGLLWSYHWMQMAIYDALLAANSRADERANIDSSIARFWSLLAQAPTTTPSMMPMAPVVAPRFSERYPEAAIVFDNLHALHDVVADILASPIVAEGAKRSAILKAAAVYRDSTTSVTSRADWLTMVKGMGSEQMGGPAPVKDPE